LRGSFVTGKEDLNSITRLEQGGLRAERKESLDEWNFRSLAVVMAEIVKTWECVKISHLGFISSWRPRGRVRRRHPSGCI
jgi:hypothetical protein